MRVTQERKSLRERQLERYRAYRTKRRQEMDRIRYAAHFPNADTYPVARADEERSSGQAPKRLFDEVPRIEGDRIVLDRIVDADADALRELLSNEKVYRFEPTFLFERQCEDVHETIRLLYGEPFANRESLILAIRLKEKGEFVGLAEFYGVRYSLRKVSIGYRLLERYWGQGIATEVVKLMLGYLYEEVGIEIITASTMVENAASARVLKKNGFIRTAHGFPENWGYPGPAAVDKWFCWTRVFKGDASLLRRATVADVPALCEARKRQLIDEGLPPLANIDDELTAYFERSLADDSLVEWVAEEDGEIVATAALAFMPFPPTYENPIGTRAYVTNMYTAPSHRGRGIASRLLDKLMEEAKERGVHKFLLSSSKMGRPVYYRRGFRKNDSWMELDL